MDIEQSITLDKSKLFGMLDALGLQIPATATLHVSKTKKEGERLVVKWFVPQPKASA